MGGLWSWGSYNWAWPAEENNYENVLAIEDSEVAAMYEMEFQGLWDHGLTP